MNARTLTVLALLAAAGLAAAFVVARPESAPASAGAGGLKTGEPFLPEVAARGGETAVITVQRPEGTTTLRSEGGTWRVAEKGGYPAKLDAVRAVVVGLSELRAEEPKTSRADQYAKLGVDDPVAPPAASADKPLPSSALVTLKDAKDATIASVIVGNPKWEGQGLTPGLYVRRAGEAQSWLVRGKVELPRDPAGFLDTALADIQRPRVKSVRIVQPATPTGPGDTIVVGRDKQADPLAIQGLADGKELKDPGAPESIAMALSGLSFQDVAKAADIDFNAASPEGAIKPGPQIEVRTFDGLVVAIAGVVKDGRQWWRLAASVDEAVASQVPAPEAPKDGPAPAAPAAGTLEALKKEAAELNARWNGYAFAPMDWKARSLNQTMADLTKDTAAPATPAPATPPSADGAAPAVPAAVPAAKP
jgi:hypothetical protein